MPFDVTHERTKLNTAIIADEAKDRFFAGMLSKVTIKMSLLHARVIAMRTMVRFLAKMPTHVRSQRSFLNTLVIAELTLMRFFRIMSLQMARQTRFLNRFKLAFVTLMVLSIMLLQMGFQRRLLNRLVVAKWTRVRLLTGVNSDVTNEGCAFDAPVLAKRAFMWFFSVVPSNMAFESAALHGAIAAQITLEGLVTGMAAHMAGEVSPFRGTIRAFIAFVRAIAFVAFNVGSHRDDLGTLVVTKGALVKFLARV